MRILAFLIVFIFMTTPAYAAPLVDNGELDLREMPLQSSGPLDLSGDWHFYWEAFLDSDELKRHEPLRIQTPTTWGSQPMDIDDHGYGTYHLRIVLSEQDVGRSLAFHIPSIASAFELYINGEQLASNGEIGTYREDMKPAALPQPLYFTPKDQVLDVVVHVSNFTQRKGGIWDHFRLGTADQITIERERSTFFQVFIATGLLLMGIYHVGLYFFRSAKSTLFFGLACLSLFLRMLFVGEMLAVRLLPSIPWEIGVKVEYLSVFVSVSFLVLYFYHLYENNFRRITSHSLALLMIGVTLPILVLPARIYTEWMLFYQLVFLVLVLYILYGLLRAAFHRRTGARLNLLAGLVYLTTVVNDILHYNFILQSIDLVTLGMFIFIFTQMFMLAKKFASAYEEVEILKDELEATNENLEDIVDQRTEALRQSNENLRKAEKARKDLLSNISHELGNPLTSVIGYLTALKDGVSQNLKERHIHIAYQKALKLERLTYDLRQLVKLENDQLTFQIERVKLRSLFEQLQHVYDWEAINRNVKVQFDLSQQRDNYVYVDVNRIEQVFTNIVDNALTHTTSDDHITIIGRYVSFANACVVAVQDTGIGIKKEDQKQLFDRFYRVKNMESERHNGSGLGLAIAKAIVETHHGRIGVLSKFGRGSTFYFILPVIAGEQT